MTHNESIFPAVTVSRDTLILALHDAQARCSLSPAEVDALERVGREATVVAMGDYTRIDGVCCPWTLAGLGEDRWATFGSAFDEAARNQVGKGIYRTLIVED